jgi:hypothetical protein
MFSNAAPGVKNKQATVGVAQAITVNSATAPIYNDGPYVFIEQNKLIEKTIRAGKAIIKELPMARQSSTFQPEASTFLGVEKVAAVSDIHGQHDVFIGILQRHQIIDEDLNWSFGKGHFVITGDIFDRGPQVLDSLWFVFNLQQQARQQGGKVHFLLGNHEYMVLHGRLDYLHDNYKATSALLNTQYPQLFSAASVLGRWLRSKSTVIIINKTIYLHGGLSESFLAHKLDLDTINRRYRESIDLSASDIASSPVYSMLHNRESPIWYRGYILDDGLSNANIDKILRQFDATRIVVGHTSLSQIEALNDGRVYAIDSSIQTGLQGELLLFSGEQVLRGNYDGTKQAFH